jgi:hypothetical protein
MWQRVVDGCSPLTAPPYGISPHGHPLRALCRPGEQAVLDRIVPGASFAHTVCQYSTVNSEHPTSEPDVKLFAGMTGATEAEAMLQPERARGTGRLRHRLRRATQPRRQRFRRPPRAAAVHQGRSANALIVITSTPGDEARKRFDRRGRYSNRFPSYRSDEDLLSINAGLVKKPICARLAARLGEASEGGPSQDGKSVRPSGNGCTCSSSRQRTTTHDTAAPPTRAGRYGATSTVTRKAIQLASRSPHRPHGRQPGCQPTL